MNETEELLVAGMERFTSDVTAPPDALVAQAAKHNRRQRIIKTAAAGGTAITAAAVIAAVAVTGPATVNQQAQTTAYVVGRTESALASSSQNLVETGRVTTSKGFGVAVASGVIIVSGGGPSTQATSLLEWAYGQRTKAASYAADGKLTFVSGTATAPGPRLTATLVDYQRKAWWRQTSPGLSPMPKQSACAMAQVASTDFLGLNHGDIAASLRAALGCGQYTLAGTQVVDGVKALKLKPVPSAERFASVTFWVDPASYLPVRSVATFNMPRKNAGRVQVDFRWLKPTAANVAKLAITIPPGFTRESTPIIP